MMRAADERNYAHEKMTSKNWADTRESFRIQYRGWLAGSVWVFVHGSIIAVAPPSSSSHGNHYAKTDREQAAAVAEAANQVARNQGS